MPGYDSCEVSLPTVGLATPFAPNTQRVESAWNLPANAVRGLALAAGSSNARRAMFVSSARQVSICVTNAWMSVISTRMVRTSAISNGSESSVRDMSTVGLPVAWRMASS